MTKKIKFRAPTSFDAALAKAGVPYELKDDAGNTYGTFTVSLFNTDSKIAAVKMNQFMRDNKELLEKHKGDQDTILVHTFVATSVHGWDGVEDEDGKAVPFSKEAAYQMLYEDADDIAFVKGMMEFAASKDNFKSDPRATKDEDAKN